MKRIVLFFLVAACFFNRNQALDIYVSPGGKGEELGTATQPYHSIDAAVEAAKDRAGKEVISLYLHDGTYYLDYPLILTPQISGTANFPFQFKAVNEGKAVISGGKQLFPKWKPYKDGIYVSKLSGKLNIDQLFIDEQREEMARYPNSQPGKNVYDCWDLSHEREADPTTDALSKDRIAGWMNPEGAYLHTMHAYLWGDMHWLVKGKDSDGKLILEGGWQNNRPSQMHKKYRMIENVFEELDAPGEWFYDKNKSLLYYFPRPGTDIHKAKVEIVLFPHLIELNGTPEQTVKHIHFEGIVFKHTARVFMDNKEPLLRSDWTVYRGGAITFNGAEHCSFRRCEFDQLGGNSIFVNNYNRHIRITGCYIHDGGANGIAFVGDPGAVRNPIFRYGPQNYKDLDLTPGPQSENYPAYCTVSDCIITRTGRTEKQTSPVQISMSFKITVSHCSIYDVPRAGVNISEGTFGGHTIEYCDIFNTVLETGDHGSFNSWGRDRFWDPDVKKMNKQMAKKPNLPFLDMVEPNIIRNNRVRCDHGWDIDLDDGSSDYRIYNNLLLNGGIKLREGYRRHVTNNIVLNNGLHPHVWPMNNGDVFKNNIVFTAHQPSNMTRGMAPDDKWGEEIDYNLYASSDSDRSKYAINGCDFNSVVADPLFIDPDKGDFRVGEESEAIRLGFRNFPMFDFGVVSPTLRSIAKTPELPEISINPDLIRSEKAGEDVIVWLGARLHEPGGQEMSGYGLNYDSKGVALALVPEQSKAWNKGFRTGDFIIGLNKLPIFGIEDFLAAMDKKGKSSPAHIHLYRNQEKFEIIIK